jgi:hypothetical protein
VKLATRVIDIRQDREIAKIAKANGKNRLWGDGRALLATTLLLTLAFPSPALAFEWDPLPGPQASNIYHWEEISPNQEAVELAPGERLRMVPDRLSVYAVEVVPPAAAGQLEFSRVFEVAGQKRASVPMEPREVGDHYRVFESTMHRETPVHIELSQEADRSADIRVFRLERSDPHYFWIDWYEQLFDWVDTGARGAPPEGLPVAGRDDALQDLERVQFLAEMLRRLDPKPAADRALRSVGRALVYRAVERVREPHFGYYVKQPVREEFVGRHREVQVETGAGPAEPATRIGRDETAVLEVEGPAQVHLGVRALKREGNPDARREYGLTVRERQRVTHTAEFSSRASEYAATESEELAEEFAPATELRAHYARGLQVDGRDESSESKDGGSGDASEEPTAREMFGRTKGGRVVGWRRKTRFWVPPGRHRFELDFAGADVLVDGTVARQKTRIRSLLTRRMDPELQLLDAYNRVEESTRPAAVLLKAERLAYLHRWEAASGLLRDHRRELVEAGGPAMDLWIQWRRLRWAETVTPSAETASTEQIRQRTEQESIPDRLVRAYGFTLARRLPNRAFEIVSLFDPAGDYDRQRLLRAQATLRSSQHPWDRWRGLADLYRWWRRRPADERLEDAMQNHWWHRTYWRDLEPAGEPESERVLEPAIWTDRQVHLAGLAGRSVWYRIRPGQRYRLRTDAAPDRPDRIARFNLQLDGRSPTGLDSLFVGGESVDVLRTSPSQTVSFAADPDATHELQHWIGEESDEPATEVFVDRPPVDATEIDPTSVVDHEDYWRLGPEAPKVWDLPRSETARFARVSIRGIEGREASTELACLFGDGRGRRVDIDWSAEGPPSENPPVQFVLPIPPGAERFTLRSSESPVHLRLEVRAGHLPDVRDNEAIQVPVDLPATDEDLATIRRLSRKVRTSSGRQKAQHRIERAKALMAIAQNQLAEVDLEQVMDRLRPGEPRFRKARLLRRTVLDRLSSDWLEIEQRFLGDRSFVPLDLEAQLGEVPTGESSCGELLREASKAMQGGDASGAIDRIREGFGRVEAPTCMAAWRILHVAATDRTGNERAALASLEKLAEQWPSELTGPWEARRRFAAMAVRRLRRQPDAVPLGRGVEAYLHARSAIQTFPSSDVQSAWYGALRWTGWEALRDPAGGVGAAVGEFDPAREPINADEMRMPVVDDPVDEGVQFALLGVEWVREKAVRLYGEMTRSLRYRVGEAEGLIVDRASVDYRPDLQPETTEVQSDAAAPKNPHRILATLRGPEGKQRPAETVGAAPEEGTQPSTRFEVGDEGLHDLELNRPDDLPGRLTFARVRKKTASGRTTAEPVGRHQLLTISPDRSGELAVSGPTLLRIDARNIRRLPAGRLVVRVTHLNSDETTERTFALPSEVQTGARVESSRLSRARRLLVPVERSGAHRIELVAKGGLATVRLWMRTDERSGAAQPETSNEETREAPASVEGDEVSGGGALEGRLTPQTEMPLDGVDQTPDRNWALFGNTGWFRDDLSLADESTNNVRDRSYLELNGGGAGALRSPEIWGRGSLGLRVRPGMPVVQQFQAAGDWRPNLWKLRIQPALQVYHQAVDRPYVAARPELRVARSFRMSQNIWWLHGVRGRLRLQPEHAYRQTDGRVAPRVYSSYADDHPATTDYLSLLWWRPFLDFVGYGLVQPVANPDWSLDKLRLRAVSRALIETTRVELGYRFTWFRNDGARDEPMLRHDIDLDGRLAYWAERGHLLSLGADVRWSIEALPGRENHELSAGLQLSYWFTGNSGTRARPPTDLTFEELLEPRYFDR